MFNFYVLKLDTVYCHSGCDKLRLCVRTYSYRVFYVQRKRVPNFVLSFWWDLTDGASDSSAWVPVSAFAKRKTLTLIHNNIALSIYALQDMAYFNCHNWVNAPMLKTKLYYYCVCTVHVIRLLNCQYQHMHNFNVID